MKFLKYLGLGLLILLVLFVLVGFLLPGSYHVERSIAIKAKPADVFVYVGDLKTWNDWTAWTKTRKGFEDMTQVFDEKTAGAGASYSWSGKTAGNGTMKIVTADPEKGITYDLNFEHGKYLSSGEIRFEAAGDNVKVTWTNNGALGLNPINRYFGLLMDTFLGPDFETGLNNLKALVEKK